MPTFIKQFVMSARKTGAIVPSSKTLSQLIVNSAQVAKAKSVVEFGPGTGVFTQKIMETLSKDATFFALEINPAFVKATKKRCPEVMVYQDSANNVKKYLKKNGIKECDCIISGLPWYNFKAKQQEELLETIIDVLKPGGIFVTFAYIQGKFLPKGKQFRKRLNQKFSEVQTTKTVWTNVPPAVVYVAKK
jgi:phospholipid N-methyltransferase